MNVDYELPVIHTIQSYEMTHHLTQGNNGHDIISFMYVDQTREIPNFLTREDIRNNQKCAVSSRQAFTHCEHMICKI